MKINNYQKGVMFILLSTLFFTLNSVVTKTLGDIPSFQRIFFMNLVATLFMFFRKTPQAFKEIKSNISLLSFRATLGFISTITYFYAINHLPLADATLLNKTSPFFVTFFSVIWLKEKVSKEQIVAMLFAIFGATLVINPSFNVDLLPTFIALLSGATAGAAYTAVRKLSHKVSPANIVFYFMLFSTIIGVIPMILQGFVMPTISQLIALVALGLLISFGQLCLSNAYKYEEASKISIYSFAQILFSSIFGLLIFGEIPTFMTIIGALVIFISGYIDYRSNLSKSIG